MLVLQFFVLFPQTTRSLRVILESRLGGEIPKRNKVGVAIFQSTQLFSEMQIQTS